jgi:ADP-ribosylarginine hydrolase
MDEKIEASIMLASYFETLGFKNSQWEFNYSAKITSLNEYMVLWNTMLHHYTILGGSTLINIKNWDSSDDTILIMATIEALLNHTKNIEDKYIQKYIKYYDILNETIRVSGLTTIDMIKLLRMGNTITTLPSKENMGGNGAALRTGPIGLYFYNNYHKVIEEAFIASRLTHNYYLGYMGGVITALFTAFAFNNIPPWEWINELLKLYDIIKYYYPKNHNIDDLEKYINFWKKYNETRVKKIINKNLLATFCYPENRFIYLLNYFPNSKIRDIILNEKKLYKLKFNWSRFSNTGLDACIYAYDCLLMSMYTPNSIILDLNNILYNLDTFMTLVCIHPGDNDTTGAIGGTWFGALNGYSNFNKNRLLELEFINELTEIIKKFKKLIISR